MADRSEAGERTVENLARRASAYVRDETDATGIALTSGVVEEALLVAHCVAFRMEGTRTLPPALL